MTHSSFIIKLEVDRLPKVSEEHKEQRKHQILMAAMEVFKRKGYEKATLKDIVEETGMSRGWIYLYFKDKIEIFEALLLHLDSQIDGAFSPQKLEQMSIISILREFLESYKLVFTTIDESIYPAIYEFWISSWREPRAKMFFSHRYDKIVTLLSDLLHAGIEKEGFKPSLPVEDIVKMLMSSVDGILVHSLAFGVKKIDAEHQIDGLLHRVEKLMKDEQFS